MVAPLRVAGEGFAAVTDPFDRATEAPRRPHDERIFGVEKIFHAKATAGVVDDDVDLVGWQIEDRVGQHVA